MPEPAGFIVPEIFTGGYLGEINQHAAIPLTEAFPLYQV
jgi:hypothetical protein